MASDQDLALVTEAEAIARVEAWRMAYERAADVAGQALRAYVTADLDLLAVRRILRTRAAASQLRDLGVQVYDNAGHMHDLQSIMGQLQAATSALMQAQKARVMQTIFGTEVEHGINR